MTPEQKARVITQLIESRQAALEMAEYHDREALRYRLQYKNLGDEITKLFQKPVIGEEIQGRSFSCVIVDDFNWDLLPKKMAEKKAFWDKLKEIKKRLLTNKKRTGKLNR